MRGIGVLPLHRFRPSIVVPDRAPDLPFQVVSRCKEPAGNEIALDRGKPQFNLIEPR